MSINQAVVANMSRHKELLETMALVEQAPQQLSQQAERISALNTMLKECGERIGKLFEKTQKERRASEVKAQSKISQILRRNTMTKGTEKSKTNYEAAVREEKQERDRQATLEQELQKARIEEAELSVKAEKYRSLQVQLSKLYDSIFSGPTPGYHEEDELEQKAQGARAIYDRVEERYRKEKRVQAILEKAEKGLNDCEVRLTEAHFWSTGAMMDSSKDGSNMEALSLKDAHLLARKIELLMKEAQKVSSDVNWLGVLSIAQTPVTRKGLGQNAFVDRVKTCTDEVLAARKKLEGELRSSNTRVKSAGAVAEQAGHTLETLTTDLDAMRRKIFEEIVQQLMEAASDNQDLIEQYLRGDFSEDAPPSYNVTDANPKQSSERRHSTSPSPSSPTVSHPSTRSHHLSHHAHSHPQLSIHTPGPSSSAYTLDSPLPTSRSEYAPTPPWANSACTTPSEANSGATPRYSHLFFNTQNSDRDSYNPRQSVSSVSSRASTSGVRGPRSRPLPTPPVPPIPAGGFAQLSLSSPNRLQELGTPPNSAQIPLTPSYTPSSYA